MREIMKYLDEVSNIKNITDKQSIIIQYDNPNDLKYIKELVHKSRRPSSRIELTPWAYIEGFVNFDYSLRDTPQNRCVRIIYECTKDNPEISPFNDRFPGCYIFRIDIERMKSEENKLWNTHYLPKNI